MKQSILRFFASVITLAAIGMSAIAGLNRGGNLTEQILVMIISVIIVLAVHLLPAISRRGATWLLWSACLVCAIFSHFTFLTHASIKAGEMRVQSSAWLASNREQIVVTQDALSAIQARPVAVVAAELASMNDWKSRAVLKTELEQAKRAEVLRNELMRLNASNTAAIAATGDPVIGKLAGITGWPETALSAGVGLLFSLLLELTGAFFWYEALRDKTAPEIQPPVSGNKELAQLQRAIQKGECRATVAAIREYLHCSQKHALELRRELAISY